MEKIKIDIVISINVFQKPSFLLKQLQNIYDNVLCSYCVVLNCNDFMFHELNKIQLPNNVFINHEIINKARFHGSLTNGIVSNMNYAIHHFVFEYFLILSGRTIFYKKMTLENLYILNKKWNSIEEMQTTQKSEFNNMDTLIIGCLGLLNDENWKIIEENKKNKKNKVIQKIDGWWPDGWYWPYFKNTKLAQYYLNNGYRLECSYHEGLCFSYNVVNNILNFFNRNLEIKDDLFNFYCCVEEFALQTISHNEVDETNLEYGFSFIGQANCSPEYYDFERENTYLYKVDPTD